MLLALSALCQPGLLVGAAVAAPTLLRNSSPAWFRWGVAIATAWIAIHFVSVAVWAWPERLAGTAATSLWPPEWSLRPSLANLAPSLADEALGGPLWLLAFRWEEMVRTGRLSHVVMRQAKTKLAHQKAFISHLKPGGLLAMTHPHGFLRLGTESTAGKPFDLALPASLARHVTVLGKTGSGKTTTALRLMEGAINSGYPVVIVDAKGLGSLRRSAETIATGMPFQVVAPGDPQTLRYNPCTGTPAQVSNKLIGAFAYGPEAEIYKNIVQETLPIVVRGLQAIHEPVNLVSIAEALDQKPMLGLAARVGDKDDAARKLLVDFSQRGSLYTSAFAGMRARLGALMHGEFAEVFAPEGTRPALDLAGSLGRPGVTYISLPTMASSEDVGLMARVLVQDIKQVAAGRIATGATEPALLLLDEFAALQEAEQLNDLLLQAREAGIACVVCTQFLPAAAQAPLLRAALMGPGVFIAHQCGAEDAEPVAQLFGTETRLDWTQQIDNQTGYSEKGTVRPVHEYLIHPDVLRSLPRGKAAIRADVETLRVAGVDVALPGSNAPVADAKLNRPAEPPAAPARRGGGLAFLADFFQATEGSGILLWAAALLIAWEGFFQWALAALSGAFFGVLFGESQLAAQADFGLTGGGAFVAVMVTLVLGIVVGGALGIAAFPFLAAWGMIRDPQASILWAGLGFAIAIGVTFAMYLSERSVGISGYRRLTTLEGAFVVPLYRQVAEELGVESPPQLLIADNPLPGAGSHLTSITITTALLAGPKEQLAAVLAHELGHYINRHALRLRLAWACALPLVLLYGIGLSLRDQQQPGPSPLPTTPLGVDPIQFQSQLLRAGISSARTATALLPRVIGDIAYFMAWPAMHLMLLPFMTAAQRHMELEADAVVARIGGEDALIHHLELARFGDWTHGGWESFSLKTHPPVAVRIDHLRGRPRKSVLDPFTRALDHVLVFGIQVREWALGLFVAGVLVALALGLLHLGDIR